MSTGILNTTKELLIKVTACADSIIDKIRAEVISNQEALSILIYTYMMFTRLGFFVKKLISFMYYFN